MFIPKPEHPRPDFYRPSWFNLNGEWEFEIDRGITGKERKFYERPSLSDKIIVPFVPESVLSGVNDQDVMKSVWYRREFTIPDDWSGGRILIHFGAVDYLTEVWINGVSAGTHKGGYTPFVFDITDLLEKGNNTVVLNAFDDVHEPMQASGKQSGPYYNHACMYTRCTGIWQTVWLEHVPDVYIKKFKLTPDVDNGKLHIQAELNTYAEDMQLNATAKLNNEIKSTAKSKVSGKIIFATMDIPNPELWQPGAPVLYDLTLTVDNDTVETYFGMRKIAINGYKVEINGKSVFQRLVLDQGYYPEGIYTAKDDDEIKNDIVLSMEAGFNSARMHMKVFEPRYIYHADKLGYLLWGEYANWGLNDHDERSLAHMLPEWMEALERDYNHPSIIGWCPFNETHPGRSALVFQNAYNVTRAFDATRLIIDSSGYLHVVTDIYDVHNYEQDLEKFRKAFAKFENDDEIFVNYPNHEKYEGQPYFVSEFGGTWWDIDEDGEEGWGYGESIKNIEEFYERYQGMIDTLLDNPRICAFCYTQITDVMQEKNGIYSFTRKVKFDMDRIRKINTRKAAIED